ncbi:MAG: TIGR00725 family protein [Candidatus Krumholzibacteria bacterium]|jgi:hypothetical protein|nr:TIGR00725 family protein [Candidatus Krumholzibacteria bacterium]MDP6668650.1 TIGR00725 family protein [Candidatus Krumholzibacteria bacterium]MDP6796335.1 TIGR00725 family protein [Candidatus Krumholzibacteria bacterium]MDP7021021.1 TIGR00725 family protein [Candidatus Krumholzibacteria bacterium]
MRKKQISVIGDSEATGDLEAFAVALGREIARRGWNLVNGGRGGVMEAASQGCREEGGLVLGILPGDDDSEGNEHCHFLLPTNMGWTRNSLNVLAGDAVIALGGRSGTLSEIAYAWGYGKPCLAVTGFGGWSETLAGTALDDRREDRIHPVSDPEEACDLLSRLLGEGS